MGLRFEEGETTLGYMRVVSDHLRQHGLPMSYYTDKHSVFRVNRKDCIDGRLRETEFHRSLRDLKIELICAHSPQAKGRVERANQTLQKRLTRELRLLNISTLEEANAYLPAFIKDYNQQFSVTPESEEDAHRLLELGEEALDLIFSIREKRKVSKNLQLSLDGDIYQILEEGQGRLIQSQSVEVRKTLSGQVKVIFEGRELKYQVYSSSKRLLEAGTKELDQVVDKIVQNQVLKQTLSTCTDEKESSMPANPSIEVQGRQSGPIVEVRPGGSYWLKVPVESGGWAYLQVQAVLEKPKAPILSQDFLLGASKAGFSSFLSG